MEISISVKTPCATCSGAGCMDCVVCPTCGQEADTGGICLGCKADLTHLYGRDKPKYTPINWGETVAENGKSES